MFLCLHVSQFLVLATLATAQSTLAATSRMMDNWVWVKFVKERMKTAVKGTRMFLFPLLKAQCLTDLAIFNKLFDHNTVDFYLRQMSVSVVTSAFFIRAFKLPVPEDLQILRPSVIGPLGHRMAVVGFLSLCYFLTTKVWLYTVVREHQSMEEIGFMQLLKQLTKQSQDKTLLAAKVISTILIINCYVFVLGFSSIELYFSISTWHLLFILSFSVALFLLPRSLPNDAIVLYVFAIAGCNAVLEQMEKLRKTAQRYPHFTFILLNEYFKTVRCITKSNPLGKFIVLLSELIVVPFGSMIFLMLSSPTDDLFALIFKVFTLVAAFAFGMFGYLLIAKLAQVSLVSKKFYVECNSLIARRQNLRPANVILLRKVIEDASCSRSHLVLREFAGTIAQMDAFESIIATLSLLTLFFSFREFNL